MFSEMINMKTHTHIKGNNLKNTVDMKSDIKLTVYDMENIQTCKENIVFENQKAKLGFRNNS